jgi:hypothetical protein
MDRVATCGTARSVVARPSFAVTLVHMRLSILAVITLAGCVVADSSRPTPATAPAPAAMPPPAESPTLIVTGLEPVTGDADGGTYVRIKGNRFIADGARNAKVFFGERQATFIRFASDSELIVEAPSGPPNELVDVLVIFAPGGEQRLANGFRFVAK